MNKLQGNGRTILSAMDNVLKASYHEEQQGYQCKEYYSSEDALYGPVKEDLAYLASELGISSKQAFLFCVIVQLCKDDVLRKSDVADGMRAGFVEFLTFEEDVRVLESKRLIQRCKRGYLKVSDGAMNALKDNTAYIAPPITGMSTSQILNKLSQIIESIGDECMDRDMGLNDIDDLILANPRTCIAKVLDEYGILAFNPQRTNVTSKYISDYCESMTRPLRMMFYVMCFRYHRYDDDEVSWYDFRNMYDSDDMDDIQTSVRQGRNKLFRRKVLTFAERDGMVVKDRFMIENSVKEKMLEDAGGLHERAVLAGMKFCTDISEKELFYNSNEASQVDSLEKMLGTDRYREVCDTLKSNGMRSGITCLFYGSPGTGKTETVYQIARRTGRNIVAADVAKLKSCWVGESEKNVKDLFRKYRQCVRDSKVTPIMLFNEADAIFGIRKSGATSGVDKMENSIQNIILQEMEDMEGILIATTNLTENLDKAFERRFLYKVQFGKPSPQIRSKIWMSMMPELTEQQALMLAEKFNFSGGQIENISRKRIVQSIISGEEAGFDDMVRFCEEENISGRSCSKIGF